MFELYIILLFIFFLKNRVAQLTLNNSGQLTRIKTQHKQLKSNNPHAPGLSLDRSRLYTYSIHQMCKYYHIWITWDQFASHFFPSEKLKLRHWLIINLWSLNRKNWPIQFQNWSHAMLKQTFSWLLSLECVCYRSTQNVYETNYEVISN